VTQDYTSHLQPAVRFFDTLAERTSDPDYAAARDAAWAWLLANPCDPGSASWMRWEGFYEDQTPAQQTGQGDHYSGHEMVVELVQRRPPGWQDLAVTLWDSLSARFLVTTPSPRYDPFTPITLEWFGWPEGTYASSLQYARTALVLHQALDGDPRQDPDWRPTALDMAAACSHGQNDRPSADDGRMFTTVRDLVQFFNVDSWYEQNFNTVKYYLELMDLEPALAPPDEVHILATDRALTAVTYPGGIVKVEYATAGGAGRERIRAPEPPFAVTAAGVELPWLGSPPTAAPGWHFDQASGVLTVVHDDGPVQVLGEYSGVAPTFAGGSLTGLRPVGPVGSGLTRLAFTLADQASLDLEIFDVKGRRVRRLVSGESYPAGDHRVTWDGRDDRGAAAGGGVYLVLGRAAGETAVTRLVLVR
jgi:hypothetical protein